MRKYFYLLLACIMTLTLSIPVYAEDENSNKEWYEMIFEDEEDDLSSEPGNMIAPRSRYIMGVQAFIQYKGSNKISLHGDVFCNTSVRTITATFSLQKLSGGSWKTVSSGTTSVSNSTKLSKSATVSGVSSGTYRTKITAKVTDSNGYSESITGYSGSITI